MISLADGGFVGKHFTRGLDRKGPKNYTTPPMTEQKDKDPKAALHKKIEQIKGQLAKEKESGKDLKKDPTCRQLRKTLKRVQRRLSGLATYTLEQQVERVDRFTELINARLSDLTQGAKKTEGNPYVHSLRKRIKSLTKRRKGLDRKIKKQAAKASSAPAAESPPAESK